MRKQYVVINLCLLVLLQFGPYTYSKESESKNIVVTAFGEAAGTGLAAKEKSLENALRNAVEKGFGVYVDSATLTENAALVYDEVAAETRGFVKYYDILEQKEQEGIFTTKIKAEVAMDKIWESESLQLLLKRMGAPRFVIIAAENHEGQPASRSVARQKVIELLVARGFHLVDAPITGNLKLQQIKNAWTDERLAADIGEKANVEVIVLVDSSGCFARKSNAYGLNFDLYQGNCEIKAVQVDSGKIIASAADDRQGGSVEDAIVAAAQDTTGEIVKQLLAAWSNYLNMGRAIQLTVDNISVSQLIRIVEELKSLEGVSSVEQRDFTGRKAQLEIKSKHKALYLAERIENLPGFNLEISRFSEEKIEVRKVN